MARELREGSGAGARRAGSLNHTCVQNVKLRRVRGLHTDNTSHRAMPMPAKCTRCAAVQCVRRQADGT